MLKRFFKNINNYKRQKIKRIVIILSSLIVLCEGLQAQPKLNGHTPVREKRGYDQRMVIDTARVRVLYALNAKNIEDENTYIDLGKLEVGKRVHKYSSEFLYLSDQKAIQGDIGHSFQTKL